LKIVYLHRTQAKGVEGVHINEIVKAWRLSGHEVQVVSPVGDRMADQDAARRSSGSGIHKTLLATISRTLPELLFEFAEIAYNFVAVRQLQKIRAFTPDLIFERYAIFAVAGALIASRRNIAFVVEVNYTSKSELVRKRSRLLAPIAYRIDKYIFSRATALAAVSSELRRHLIEEYGVQGSKILVLPNAADPIVFDPAIVSPTRELIGGDFMWIGFVGGFYPWHGVDLLVEAFCRIEKKIPCARLVLIGDGPMKAKIVEQCARLGVTEKVSMTGQIAHQKLPEYVCKFHIGVMPDSNNYGSPMKIFEYMALGKPVVVPDYGPLLDVITDGEEGKVFAARSIEELAHCLEYLLSDNDAYMRMSAKARAAILTKHNWVENSRRILALLPEPVK
jgi:glycosyltransferase involved in cell wall biosynthesis